MVTITRQESWPPHQHSESDVVLSVDGISKKFCRDLKQSLFYGVKDIASEVLGTRRPNRQLRPKEFWALNDVNFQVRRGEAIGLVGRNGSGKSTLLRMIAGLIKPDAGSIKVVGRVAPLIALGAGFNPILSGRENIYANMSVLGVPTKEIRDRFDEVVEFAEIGEALDAPVQSYSSGMAARLGFACAIHTNPDILLIDEVLAVGDSRFRAKCFRKLHELRQNNTAFILVNHDSHAILTLCESAVYLNKGVMVSAGQTAAIMRHYEQDLLLLDSDTTLPQGPILVKPQLETSELEMTGIIFRDGDGQIVSQPTSGMSTMLCIQCQVYQPVNKVGVTVIIQGIASGGEAMLVLNCLHDQQPLTFEPGRHEIRLEMPHLGLKPGGYSMNIYSKRDGYQHLDGVEGFRFQVDMGIHLDRGIFYQPRSWKVVDQYHLCDDILID
jgi:lipopolysaccharide transport system ATP-binding protein